MKLDRESLCRLTSYSAAAGLGAFAVGSDAEAAVLDLPTVNHTELPEPEVITVEDDTYHIDFTGNGDHEMAILNHSAATQFRDQNNEAALTSQAGYYVRAFEEGDMIDLSTPQGDGAPGTAANANYNFIGTGGYVGIRFEFDEEIYHGWARVDVTGGGGTGDPRVATLYSYAWETRPNEGIAAGTIPEPSSLALLAAGAGAMALRRRKQNA